MSESSHLVWAVAGLGCAAAAAWLTVPSSMVGNRAGGPASTNSGGPDGAADASAQHRFVGVALLIGVPALVMLGGPAAAVAGSAVAALVVLLTRRRRARRQREQWRARLGEATEQLAAELTAGLPAGTALAHVADAWPAFAPVARAQQLGGDVPSAVRALGGPNQPEAELVAAAWSVGIEVGGSLQPALAAAATRLSAARRRARVIDAELASARATGRLMATLPVLALMLGSALGARPWSFLFDTSAGRGCLAVGLALGLTGLWWIEVLADRARG